MKKDVIISITGMNLQNDDMPESQAPSGDVIEFITTGNLYDKNGKYYIMYRESEMTGFGEETTTTLKVDGDVITLMRNGPASSQMVFEKGKKHLGYYETPYGSFTVGTVTDHASADLSLCGGRVDISYDLEINSVMQGRNNLHMDVREAGSDGA